LGIISVIDRPVIADRQPTKPLAPATLATQGEAKSREYCPSNLKSLSP